MTTHLSTQEFVDAVEQTLTADRQDHLAGCEACQAQVDALRAVLSDAETAGDVPEPSPLFWEHFQQRVQSAVAAEAAQPAGWSWRALFGSPRTVLAAGVTVAAVAIAVSLSTPRLLGPGSEAIVSDDVADTSLAVDEAGLDGAEWEFVSDVMSTLEEDDARQVLAPSRHAMDAAFESLTSAERDVFISLLAAEMGTGSE